MQRLGLPVLFLLGAAAGLNGGEAKLVHQGFELTATVSEAPPPGYAFTNVPQGFQRLTVRLKVKRLTAPKTVHGIMAEAFYLYAGDQRHEQSKAGDAVLTAALLKHKDDYTFFFDVPIGTAVTRFQAGDLLMDFVESKRK